MTKEESKTVKQGDTLNLQDVSTTPGREFSPIADGEVKVKRILIEKSGHVHFDIGMVLIPETPPLKSRDTGEELDDSETYWMHPSRFDKIETNATKI